MRRQWSWLLTLIAALAGPAEAQPRGLGLVSYKEPVVPKLEIDASAVVVFTIRANGRVADAVTLTATNRVLGDSARDAVLEWRFERDPTLGRGRDAEPGKVLRRELVEFVFKRDGIVTSMSHRDSAKSWFPAGLQARRAPRSSRGARAAARASRAAAERRDDGAHPQPRVRRQRRS